MHVPFDAQIILEKTEINSSETLRGVFNISEAEGHFYLAVDSAGWTVVGVQSWEVNLRRGESKEVEFSVKLKTPPLREIDEIQYVFIRVSPIPFDIGFRNSWAVGTRIRILDYRVLTDSAMARMKARAPLDSVRIERRQRLFREYIKKNGKRPTSEEFKRLFSNPDSLDRLEKALPHDTSSSNIPNGPRGW